MLQNATASGWMVLGASGSGPAENCQDVEVRVPTILVMGESAAVLCVSSCGHVFAVLFDRFTV